MAGVYERFSICRDGVDDDRIVRPRMLGGMEQMLQHMRMQELGCPVKKATQVPKAMKAEERVRLTGDLSEDILEKSQKFQERRDEARQQRRQEKIASGERTGQPRRRKPQVFEGEGTNLQLVEEDVIAEPISEEKIASGERSCKPHRRKPQVFEGEGTNLQLVEEDVIAEPILEVGTGECFEHRKEKRRHHRHRKDDQGERSHRRDGGDGDNGGEGRSERSRRSRRSRRGDDDAEDAGERRHAARMARVPMKRRMCRGSRPLRRKSLVQAAPRTSRPWRVNVKCWEKFQKRRFRDRAVSLRKEMEAKMILRTLWSKRP
eukprot:Skav223526  [mRNA]  locus=scaffold1160:335070:340278:+ [translate_table: standard]